MVDSIFGVGSDIAVGTGTPAGAVEIDELPQPSAKNKPHIDRNRINFM